MAKTIEQWLLFKYIDGELTLSQLGPLARHFAASPVKRSRSRHGGSVIPLTVD